MQLLVAPMIASPSLLWASIWSATSGAQATLPDDPAPAHEDEACMLRVMSGDPDSLQPIFDRWKLPLLSYFYRAIGSRADAEDLALTTFGRVYRSAKRFDPKTKFSTWLFAIARNELLHELRRRRRKPVEPVPPEDLAFLRADTSAAEHRSTIELEEQLLLALQELPERQRSAILMTAAGDLSHDEIARSMKISVSNLNVILHRARLALRSLFQRNP